MSKEALISTGVFDGVGLKRIYRQAKRRVELRGKRLWVEEMWDASFSLSKDRDADTT